MKLYVIREMQMKTTLRPIIIYFYLFIFLAMLRSLWDLSSLTRDGTHALSRESAES